MLVNKGESLKQLWHEEGEGTEEEAKENDEVKQESRGSSSQEVRETEDKVKVASSYRPILSQILDLIYETYLDITLKTAHERCFLLTYTDFVSEL